MAEFTIKAGTTSKLLPVFLQDSSSSVGAGLTGLVFNTTGLTAYYYREGAASTVAITLATQTLGTWATGGFIAMDGTNMPGCYQLSIPDAAIAAGAKSCWIFFKGAANLAHRPINIELTAVDNQSTTAFMTGINSLAPPTNWNLDSIDANGRRDVIKIAGIAQTPRDIGASVLLSAGTGAGQLDFTSGVVKANLAQILGTALTETAGQIAAAFKKFFDKATPTGTINSIPDAVAGATGGLFIAGTNAATSITTALTANITGNVSGSVGSVTGAVGSVTGAVGSVTGAVGSVTAGVTVTTNNDKTGYGLSAAAVQAIWDALTSALTTIGSIGKLLVDNINATISSRLASASYTAPDNTTISTINTKIGTPVVSVSTDIAGVQSDTDNIQTRLPAALVSGRMDASVGAMAADVVSAAALATDAANEIRDAVWAKVFSELAQVTPAATPSAEASIMLMYQALRNRLDVDATNKKVTNDAGTVICKKVLSDNGTTYSEAKMVAGP